MFDEKMRGLPKGTEFFCKVHYCGGSYLAKAGAKTDDVLRCKILSDDHKNPVVKFFIDDKEIMGTSDGDFYEKLVTYEGRIDLTGFICDESKAKASKVLTVNVSNQA